MSFREWFRKYVETCTDTGNIAAFARPVVFGTNLRLEYKPRRKDGKKEVQKLPPV